MKFLRIECLAFLVHVFVAATNANSLRGEASYNVAEEWQEQPRQLAPATDTFIFQTQADGFATGQGNEVGADCSTDTRRVTFVDGDGSGDYMDIVTTKWHSGGYRMDCKDRGSHTGWQCWATCSPFPNPNFMDWDYLTFEVKVANKASLPAECIPRVKITKRWPSYSSNSIPLAGTYVDGGVLTDSEFRRVVIPIGTSDMFVRCKAPQLSWYSQLMFFWALFSHCSRFCHRRMA